MFREFYYQIQKFRNSEIQKFRNSAKILRANLVLVFMIFVSANASPVFTFPHVYYVTVSELSLYPNPTRDVLTLSLGDFTQDEILSVDILNLSGAKVASFADTRISLEKQEAGMYLIVVKTQNGNVYQQTVVKE